MSDEVFALPRLEKDSNTSKATEKYPIITGIKSNVSESAIVIDLEILTKLIGIPETSAIPTTAQTNGRVVEELPELSPPSISRVIPLTPM